MRVVIDTNVLVSAALLETSLPGQAVYKALEFADVLLSIETLSELHEVLQRPKFERYLTAEEREEFLVALALRAEMIEISVQINDCRDPKDNKFLALAVDGNANIIISGDGDLLVLDPYRGVEILSPAVFLIRHGNDQ